MSDLSEQAETPDFEFFFDRARVGLEVKAKLSPYSAAVAELWPEIPAHRLFIVDEVSLRKLFQPEGLGYLLVHDAPRYKWVVFGPWHLIFGPNRRYERATNDGRQSSGKGKLLLDFEVGEQIGANLDVERVLRVVRRARSDTAERRAIRIRNAPSLPVVPRSMVGGATDDRNKPDGVEGLVRPVDVGAEAPFPDANAGADEVEPAATTAWCGLSRQLSDRLVARFGWAAPTPVQAEAIPPILSGNTTLVLAPTAGGKTEAAALPLLDMAQRGRWGPLSIVAVSPMKALLDDQLRRYTELGELTGAISFAWHGDTPSAARRTFLESPSDVLLTTPESLEILLHNNDAKTLFSRVRAVIVDEVHAFVGTPRGAQLAAVLERLGERTTHDLQRVGLSATVGAPDQVLAWLGGSSFRERSLAQVPASAVREETSIVTYDDDTELAHLLGGVMAEQRTLVFVPSRRRAEDLGAMLEVPVHHSSVHADAKQVTVDRFRAGDVSGVVATSTLELGIDIGDVELVAQDGSPSGPASYLQRVGRSGRRSGVRRMLFTCGSPDDLLQVLAVLARVRRGALDPLPVRRGARLVLGQQALALALDPTSVGMSRSALSSALCYSPVFRGLEVEVDEVLDHLLAGSWLGDVGGHLVAGSETMERFGGRGRAFAELAVSFESRASIAVVAEDGRLIGSIDWGEAQADKRIGSGDPFTLAGRAWRGIDVVDGALRVVPAQGGSPAKAPSWRGPSLEVDRATWEVAREVLEGTDVPTALDDRGERWLAALRLQWGPRLVSPLRSQTDEIVLATFAGAAVHRSALAMLGANGATDGPELRIVGGLTLLRQRASAVLGGFEAAADVECRRLVPDVAATVKHGRLLPESVMMAEAREFMFDAEGVRKVLALLAEE